MMFAGVNGKPVLYTTDITGNYLRYKANAIGENDEKLRKLLREKLVVLVLWYRCGGELDGVGALV